MGYKVTCGAKLQGPSSKLQISSKSQAPKIPKCSIANLGFGTWSFFGIWSLEVGASLIIGDWVSADLESSCALFRTAVGEAASRIRTRKRGRSFWSGDGGCR